MNKRIVLFGIFLLLFAEIISVYWLRMGFYNTALREFLSLLPPFFAAISGFVALANFGYSTNRSLTLIFLTGGMCYWFFGEILFDYFTYVLHTNPYPSAADIFSILAYPMLFLGLMNEIHKARVNWKNITKPTIFLFILVALLLATIVGYFGIYQAYDANEKLLSNIIAMSYGVGDLLLILANILLLVLVWEFHGGKLSRVWFILFCGFIFTLIADILFAMHREQYTMQEWFYKSLLDSFWILGYLFFATAFFEFTFAIQDTYRKALSQAREKGVPSKRLSS